MVVTGARDHESAEILTQKIPKRLVYVYKILSQSVQNWQSYSSLKFGHKKTPCVKDRENRLELETAVIRHWMDEIARFLVESFLKHSGLLC